jgi:hypothetical protein
LPFLDNIGV